MIWTVQLRVPYLWVNLSLLSRMTDGRRQRASPPIRHPRYSGFIWRSHSARLLLLYQFSISSRWWCVWKAIQESSECKFKWFKCGCFISWFRKEIPEAGSFNSKGIVVLWSNWALSSWEESWYGSFQAETLIFSLSHVYIIRSSAICYFPHVDYNVSLSASLEWHKLQFFEALLQLLIFLVKLSWKFSIPQTS